MWINVSIGRKLKVKGFRKVVEGVERGFVEN